MTHVEILNDRLVEPGVCYAAGVGMIGSCRFDHVAPEDCLAKIEQPEGGDHWESAAWLHEVLGNGSEPEEGLRLGGTRYHVKSQEKIEISDDTLHMLHLE